MRTKNSFRNMYTKILTQVIIILIGFISRKVFIDSLGHNYLGVNALLTSILSMLGLVEGGIGVSIVYNLYKPLAENNKEKIIALVQLYKKIYMILAGIIFLLSIVIYPFLNKLINNSESIPFIGIVYFIFIIKNMISYLNAHKWSLINADQKEYIITRYNLIFNIMTTVIKIIVLKATNNYILYLAAETLVFIIENIVIGDVVNRKYPYIKTKEKYNVEESIIENLIVNTKSLFLHNIGGWCVFGTDNILISLFIGLKTTGLYSNYVMITSQLAALIDPVISSMGASIGNLIATENNEKKYNVFEAIYLINFWLYSVAVIFLLNLVEPFINWCFGLNNLLERFTFIVILINFYLKGMRNSILIFKYKGGLFKNDRYATLIEAAINLIASIILVKYLGVSGIFLGTTISTIAVPLWVQSKVVYTHIFKKSLKEYFKKYIMYIFITLLTCLLTTHFCSLIPEITFWNLIIKGLICISLPNIIYIVLFYNNAEFKYILNAVKTCISKTASEIGEVY